MKISSIYYTKFSLNNTTIFILKEVGAANQTSISTIWYLLQLEISRDQESNYVQQILITHIIGTACLKLYTMSDLKKLSVVIYCRYDIDFYSPFSESRENRLLQRIHILTSSNDDIIYTHYSFNLFIYLLGVGLITSRISKE